MKRINLYLIFMVIFTSTNLISKSWFAKPRSPYTQKVPIIFHKRYDISFWGMEKLHPFDSCKYGKVANFLINSCDIDSERMYEPEMVSDADLLTVHTQEYLNRLNDPAYASRIAEVAPLAWISAKSLQSRLYEPMRYATGGTMLACKLSLTYGWAVNLSGGYHHAKANSGEGFCFFADIPIAVNKLWNQKPNLKVMVIDLDAHQGNGVESIFKDDKRVAVFDVYNSKIYPNDYEVKKYIKYNFPLNSNVWDSEYLALISRHLPKALNEFKPDLIIYNAGTDIFEEDPLGNFKVSAEGIIERDSIVFDMALERNIPITMVLSGGYSTESAKIIGDSLQNILKKPKVRKFVNS